MLHSVTHRAQIIEPPAPPPFIACQTLEAFLSLGRFQRILLARMERKVSHEQFWQMQGAILLTGMTLERSICYATFFPAVVTGSGTTGAITTPASFVPQASILSEDMARLIHEFQDGLLSVFRQQRLSSIQEDACYHLPDAVCWKVHSRAETSGIHFRENHWIFLPQRF